MIVVTETRIAKQVSLLNNLLSLNNYSCEFNPNETTAGDTLICIANNLSYKCRNDLNINKKNELKSPFTEIVNSKNQILL